MRAGVFSDGGKKERERAARKNPAEGAPVKNLGPVPKDERL